MRLVLLVGALVLWTGAAEAKGSSKADDERVCTTVTTVVRRGPTVLSTTSSTRCDEDKTGAVAASPGPRADPIVPPSGALENSRGLSSSLFGLGTPGLKPRDVLGEWSAAEPGATYACQVRLTREAVADGYRVFTSGCRGPLGGATAWRFEETLAGLYAADGTAITKLGGDKRRLAGKLAGGQTVELSR